MGARHLLVLLLSRLSVRPGAELREELPAALQPGRGALSGRGALVSTGLGKDMLVASLCFDLDQQ